MAKPITPMVACDVFVVDSEQRVLLVKRADNGRWALPGGCQDLGETPAECAVRECLEETGLVVRVTHLLGVLSSMRYRYITYPWKENEFCHVLFMAELIGGTETPSEETPEIGWFHENNLPVISDGHDVRLELGFNFLRDPIMTPYFE